MESQRNDNGRPSLDNNVKQPWYGSKSSFQSDRSSSDDVFMTFQSKDPIISIPLQEKGPRDKVPGGDGGEHVHIVEHPTSYVETLMHLFKGNVGSGIFAMGDAVKNAGIIVGPVLTVILGIICVHCQHMLVRACSAQTAIIKPVEPLDYAETVQGCFANGPPKCQKYAATMKHVINVFLCITQLGFCCVYFVFISQNIKQVLDYYGYELDVHLHMAIILLPLLLTSLIRNLKYLAPFSTFANVLMALGITICIYYASFDLPSVSERPYLADFKQLPLFFGTALFAFEGIGLVLPLQNEMSNPKRFGDPMGVLNVGMAVVITLYIVVGFLGYLRYGEGIEGSITLNLPQEDVLAQVVKVMISLGILFTYALQLYIPVDIIWPFFLNHVAPKNYPVFSEMVFRSLLVLLTFTLAEAIPYLSLFISLVGAVSSSALALLFPPILELIVEYTDKRPSWYCIAKNVFIIFFSAFGMVTGGIASIDAIYNAMKKDSE